MPDDLKTTLERYSSAAITLMVSYHGIAPKGSKMKAQMIETLASVLIDRRTIEKSLAVLSKGERAALDAVLRRAGHVAVQHIRGELLRLKLIDRDYAIEFGAYRKNTPNPRRHDSRRLEDLLASLTLRGLLFSADDPADPKRGVYDNATKCDFDQALQNVFIPEVIRRHLPAPEPLPELEKPQVVTVSAAQESSARTFQRDLYLYWSLARSRQVALTAKGEIHKRTLVELNDALLQHDEIGKGAGEMQAPRLRFIRGLLQAIGLLHEIPKKAVQALDQPEFFGLAPADRVKRSYELWLSGNFFSELLLLPRDWQPSQPALLPAPSVVVEARHSVIEHIRELRSTDWIAFERLIDLLDEYDREFLLPWSTYRASAYYYSPPHPYGGHNAAGLVFPAINSLADGWKKIEANFIRGLITGPLFWMGLIDLGWTAKVEGAPLAFRLNALGAWLLGLGPRPEIRAEGGRVIVQPNLHIVALDPVNDTTLVTLDQFAERLNAERAVEYQFTRASVYRGQQQGWEVPRIQAWLREQTGAELPANVARTLDEWQTLHERIIIHPHVALAHGSPVAIDTLLDDAQAAPLIVSRPLPEVALAHSAQSIKPLTQALHQRGLLPLITLQPTVTPNAIVVTDVGEITFTTRMPSLYLHGHLAAIADPIDDAHYQITAETIERATRSGLTAPQIIEQLSAVQRGRLPERLVRHIRAWAKYYGDASIESMTLLQVRDNKTLDELLADPEIAALLRPFAPNRTKALARVREKDLDALRALLRERGIELGDRLR